MRNLFALVSVVFFTCTLRAQSPEKISYQAVIRDVTGHLVTTEVKMRLSILQGSATGTPVYEEIQTRTPNVNGLVTVEIGAGTPVSGNFEEIDWSSGPYYLKSETDPSGGTTYDIVMINQLCSVPFSLYTKTRGGHYIGEFFGGGIVVTVTRKAGAEHGLIASLTNLGPDPGSTWGDTTTLVGTGAESLTDGQTNTTAIVARSPTVETAAKLCDDYINPETGTGVFSDWYLPSMRELEECYNANFAITNILGIADGFRFDNYWSSTENKDDRLTAYFKYFHNGILSSGGHKWHLLRVRAIRKY